MTSALRLTCPAVLAVVVAAAFAAPGCTRQAAPAPDPLIPLRTLLAQPAYDAVLVSPDGRWIAYVGPVDGAANLLVAPVAEPLAARPLTRLTGRGIAPRDVSGNVMIRFTLDSTRLLLPLDRDGDEAWNLHTVELASGALRNLTELPGAKVELLALAQDDPDLALIALTEPDRKLPDVYRLDLRSGQRTLVVRNDPAALGRVVLAWTADHTPAPRFAYALNEAGGIDVMLVEGSDRDTRLVPFLTVDLEDMPALSANSAQRVPRFDSANRRFFYYDSRGRDTIALAALDPTSGERTVLAEDPRADLAAVLFHPTRHEPQAYATLWTRLEWHALDPELAADLAQLEQLAPASAGEIAIDSRSHDDRVWVVRSTVPHQSETFFLYHRPERKLERLFERTPALAGLPLARMHALELRARDGLPLVSYLSLPPWRDPDGDGRPDQPVPLVVLVHGGPSDERARFGFGPFLHWLANRGYGVLYANYRGSPGFGKAFVNAQRMEWGGKMHDDLLDQVEWAIAQRITTPERVAILGGSYGGYAALVGMTMTPFTFACGVDLVGPSNLEIFMPHWNVDVMARTLGDPRTEDGRAFLRSRSPITHAHRAKHPILIGQGANDSRVPQAQSDTMVAALERAGAAVTYVLYPDEGHGLVRDENAFSFWAITEAFLARCLGGRSQPIGDQLAGSSARVLAGAAWVPGLTEALARKAAASGGPRDASGATVLPLAYPAAPAGDEPRSLHGERFVVPFLPLADRGSRVTREWLAAQNALTDRVIDRGVVARLERRLDGLWPQPPPLRHQRGATTISVETGLNGLELRVQRAAEPTARVLLAPADLLPEETIEAENVAPSPSGARVAVTLARAGREGSEIRVVDVASSRLLDDRIPPTAVPTVAWHPLERGFFYNVTRWLFAERPFGQADGLYWHELGTPAHEDRLLFPYVPGTGHGIHPWVPEAAPRLLAVTANYTTGKRGLLLFALPDDPARGLGAPTVLLPDGAAELAVVGVRGRRLYLLARLDSPTGRIWEIDLDAPARERWRAVLESPSPIELESYRVTSTRALLAGESLVLARLVDTAHRVDVFDLDGRFVRTLALPAMSSVLWLEPAAGGALAATATTPLVPWVRFNCHPERGPPVESERAPGGLDPARFEVSRNFALAGDGTRLPVLVVRPAQAPGALPTLLYAYGGFGQALAPRYDAIAALWLELGGQYAQASVRGGGEYGTAWHDAGRLLHKQTTFNDVYAVADHLVSTGATTPAQLALRGLSAGGLLAAVAWVQRPELFSAIVAEIPLVDVLSLGDNAAGQAITAELGDARASRETFAALRRYSPLHTLAPRPGRPPLLVVVAQEDQNAPPGQAYRFAARAQELTLDTGVVLLRTLPGMGHVGWPRAVALRTLAEEVAFLRGQ